MNDFTIYDHVVTKKSSVGSVAKQTVLLIGILLLAAGLLLLGLTLKLFPVFLGLTVAVVFGGVLWLRKYARIEYEYEIVSGEVTFSEIFNRRSRRIITTFQIKQCHKVIPVDHADAESLPGTLFAAVSGTEAPHIYLASFDDEHGRPAVVMFEMTAKALSIFRSYNPSATVMTKIED